MNQRRISRRRASIAFLTISLGCACVLGWHLGKDYDLCFGKDITDDVALSGIIGGGGVCIYLRWEGHERWDRLDLDERDSLSAIYYDCPIWPNYQTVSFSRQGQPFQGAYIEIHFWIPAVVCFAITGIAIRPLFRRIRNTGFPVIVDEDRAV